MAGVVEVPAPCVVEEPVEPEPALAELLSAGVVEVAWADFCSIWWADFSDVATAPWALARSLVRPSTPGAEPW